MNPFEELSELIGETADAWLMSGHRVKGSSPEGESAKAVLAAGYSKPRTITTVAELDALPIGSVILDPIGLSLHKNEFMGWRASNGAKDITAEMLQHEALPATVIHEP